MKRKLLLVLLILFIIPLGIKNVYAEEVVSNMQSYLLSEKIWWCKGSISKIVFQNKLEPIDKAAYTFDISEDNDGSVMSYLVRNDDGTYTCYIQGNGKIYAPKDSSYLFFDFNCLESIEGMKYFDTSNVTNMSCMFYGCLNLTKLDIGNFDTSNVTDMSYMFFNCYNLKEIDFNSFDTSNVVNMSRMFEDCDNLEKLDLSSFNTSNVTDMSYMFFGCNLKEIDISSFDTSNVTDMSCMFEFCGNLTKLDLSSFDTSNVTDMSYMFAYDNNLKTIYVSDKWSTHKVEYSYDTFYGAINLVGEKGTIYNADHIDKEYAHVDGGEDNPGYLSYKYTFDIKIINSSKKYIFKLYRDKKLTDLYGDGLSFSYLAPNSIYYLEDVSDSKLLNNVLEVKVDNNGNISIDNYVIDNNTLLLEEVNSLLNPNTSSNSNIIVFGIVILLVGIIFVYRNKVSMF